MTKVCTKFIVSVECILHVFYNMLLYYEFLGQTWTGLGMGMGFGFVKLVGASTFKF